MIIALDGPSGSGKSTIAKLLAKQINFDYLDTGAMYRVICYYILENEIDYQNDSAYLQDIKIEITDDKVFLNGKDVSLDIRTDIINEKMPFIVKDREIREKLVMEQRAIANDKDIILDGRDIGTVVFPDAKFKFYIDASSSIRATRRFEQNKQLGIEADYEVIKSSIEKRDYEDTNREIGPLKKAEDAIYIDTSNMSIDEVINVIRKEIDGK